MQSGEKKEDQGVPASPSLSHPSGAEPVPVSGKAGIANADALLALAERVEKAAGPDRELEVVIHEAVTTFPARRAGVGWPDENALVVPAFPGWVLLPAYTASLDAAMSLLPEGWGGNVNWPIGRNHGPYEANLGSPQMSPAFVTVVGKLPAVALTAAALRALAHEPRNG